jgi:hypothetical protein
MKSKIFSLNPLDQAYRAAAKLLNDPAGIVSGKQALRSYFQRGQEMYPNLTFGLLDVM